MANFVTKTLMGKMVASFVAVTLIAIVAVGYLSVHSAKAALEQGEFEKLRAIRFQQDNALIAYFESAKDQLLFLAKTRRAQRGLEALIAHRGESHEAASVILPDDHKERISGLEEVFATFLEMNGPSEGYEDVLLVDARDGQVLYTGKKLADATINLRSGNLLHTGPGKVTQRVIETQKPALSDLAAYQPTGSAGMFLGVPMMVSLKDRKLAGVLIARMNANKIGNIMKLNQGAGETVRSYLVGQDLMFRSSSRVESDSVILKTNGGAEAAKRALSGNKGHEVTSDYRGEPVLCAYQELGLGRARDLGADFKWGLITQIDHNEAMGPAEKLSSRIMIVALLTGIAAAATASVVARSTAKPIMMLAEVATRLGRGDLTVTVPELNRSDELRVLGDAFRNTIENLRKQIGRILEGVNVLSSAVTGVGATVTQVAASAAQTSSAVTETITTVEQVRQAANLSRDKARSVAQSAQQSVHVSGAGKSATQKIMEKMALIQQQMTSIGETVVRLSEHSKSIESIIDGVQDIADQSNLLAVNASIEAARAGDQGKGFSIVAQEIKTLADQSRRSTEEVRTILDENRKWVGAVVMATEQGGKAVQAGLQESDQTRVAIEQLSVSVEESSLSANVIQSSSEQQAVGVAQVSTAMASIDAAMHQISEGTGQLNAAAEGLTKLGTELRESVQHYKL